MPNAHTNKVGRTPMRKTERFEGRLPQPTTSFTSRFPNPTSATLGSAASPPIFTSAWHTGHRRDGRSGWRKRDEYLHKSLISSILSSVNEKIMESFKVRIIPEKVNRPWSFYHKNIHEQVYEVVHGTSFGQAVYRVVNHLWFPNEVVYPSDCEILN